MTVLDIGAARLLKEAGIGYVEDAR